MDSYTRGFGLTRGEINLKTGRFPLTLFTNGQVDGDPHVIDVKSLVFDERVTMYVNHDADPTKRAGGIVGLKKVGKTDSLGGGSLKGWGVLDMEGDSERATIARDLGQGISVGDVHHMSGRWSGGKATARASLDKGHYAYSSVEGGYETPLFFEGSFVEEGSIVGVASDKNAFAGRAGDLKKPEYVREFWRSLAAGQVPEVNPLETRDVATLETFEFQVRGEDWIEIYCDDGSPVWVPPDVATLWNARNTQEETSVEQPEQRAAELSASRQEEAMRESLAILAQISSPEFVARIHDDAFGKAMAKHLGAVV